MQDTLMSIQIIPKTPNNNDVIPYVDEAIKIIDDSGRNIRLEVDGGVGVDNIAKIAEAGADMFVSGSAIFNQPDYKAVIDAMRSELAKVES